MLLLWDVALLGNLWYFQYSVCVISGAGLYSKPDDVGSGISWLGCLRAQTGKDIWTIQIIKMLQALVAQSDASDL